ncbi:MAG: conjugative transposon protein TraN [Cyclobacteriaceae bacterium]
MKSHSLILLLGLGLIMGSHQLLSQSDLVRFATDLQLGINYNKTTSLIFPSVITTVDLGSKDVVVRKANSVSNVLQVKAAHKDFLETNLTVITADGDLHHFTVQYQQDPVCLIYKVNPSQSDKQSALIFQLLTEAQFKTCAEKILNNKHRVKSRSTRKNKIILTLNGIHIHDDVLFMHLTLRNVSNINYTTDMLRFYVEDTKQAKRTAAQEIDKKPIYRHGDHTKVPGKSTSEVVFAFEKFTIPDAKHFVIELFERHGGRHLTLTTKNRALVKARTVNPE